MKHNNIEISGYRGHWVLCAVIAIAAFVTVGHAGEVALSQGGQAQAVIVVGEDGETFDRWVAGELQQYIEKLSGATLPIVSAGSVPADKPVILVGGPQSNPLVAQAQAGNQVDFEGLKADGLVLKTIEWAGRPAIVAGGNDDRGTMYAAYELLEQMGIVFQAVNSVIPALRPDLAVSEIDVRMEPAFKYRGTHKWHGISWWMGLDEIRRQIDQLAKMKGNVFLFYCAINGPFVEFSHNGKVFEIEGREESRFVAWSGCSGTADEVVVGREVFPEDGYMGPPEFAHVGTQAEAFETAREFFREIIQHAHSRGMEVWMSLGEVPYIPTSLVPRGVRTHAGFYCGTAIAHGEPALLEIWEAAALSMIESYPEVDRYWLLTGAEHQMQTVPPQTQELIRDYEHLRPLFQAHESQVRADIELADVAVADQLVRRIKDRYPDEKLGILMLMRGGQMRPLDAVLPKDVALMNMVHYHRGAGEYQMDLFEGIEDRDLVVWARVTDDAAELHIQLNNTLYESEVTFPDAVRYGLAGVMGQTNKDRGAEQSTAFILEACWDPALTARDFYERYLLRLHGSAALETLLEAFMLLEENEREFGWETRKVGTIFPIWNPRWGQHFASLRTGVDFTAEQVELDRNQIQWQSTRTEQRRHFYQSQTERYRQALAMLRRARPEVLPGSRDELDYVIFKVGQFATMLEQMASLLEAQVEFDRALLAMSIGNAEEIDRRLEGARSAVERAEQLLRDACAQAIPYADIPEERHLLWILNRRFPSHEAALKHVNEAIAFHREHRREPLGGQTEPVVMVWTGGQGESGDWGEEANWLGQVNFSDTTEVIFHATLGATRLHASSLGGNREVRSLTFNGEVKSPLTIYFERPEGAGGASLHMRTANNAVFPLSIYVDRWVEADVAFLRRRGSGGIALHDTLLITHHGNRRLLVNVPVFAGSPGAALVKTGSGTVYLNAANTYTGPTTIQSGGVVLGPAGNLDSKRLGFGVTDSESGWLEVENPAFSFRGTLDLSIASVGADGTQWQLFRGAHFRPESLQLTAIVSDMPELVFSREGPIWTADDGSNIWTFDQSTGELGVMRQER